MLTCICSKEEMTLSNILTVLLGSYLALSYLTQVMLWEVALVTRFIAHFSSAKIIIRLSHGVNAIFLDIELVSVGRIQTRSVIIVHKIFVVLISRSPIVCDLLISKLEVGHSHGLPWVANISGLSLCKLFWCICMCSRGLISEPNWLAYRWCNFEIWISRLLNQFSIRLLSSGDSIRVQALSIIEKLLRRRFSRKL